MAWTLKYGRKIYNYWGNHPALYRIASGISFLGKEDFLRSRAIQLLQLHPDDIVFDLACGNGVNFLYLQHILSSKGNIIGLDYSEGMLSYARKRIRHYGWHNIQLIQADASHYYFDPESLDGAFCSLALSAIPDHVSAMRNVYHALKKRGHFVVLDAKLFTGIGKILNPLIKPIF